MELSKIQLQNLKNKKEHYRERIIDWEIKEKEAGKANAHLAQINAMNKVTLYEELFSLITLLIEEY